VVGIRDAAKVGWHERARDGVRTRYPYFEVDGHHVWGATAMIPGEFASLFVPDFGPRTSG